MILLKKYLFIVFTLNKLKNKIKKLINVKK